MNYELRITNRDLRIWNAVVKIYQKMEKSQNLTNSSVRKFMQ